MANESSNVVLHSDTRPLSAVAVFHNIISPVTSKLPSDTRSSVTVPAVSNNELSFTGPNDLPTEILLLIFQFAFEASVDGSKMDTLPSGHATLWLEDDPLSPSLFPYSLASVCLRWFHILSSIPAYWTRQVIIVDCPVTPLTAVQTLLQWTGDLSLHLIVTKNIGPSDQTDKDEHARVCNVFDILRPYICNTRFLTFNLKYSSSIPAIWRERGDAKQLRVLTLMSDMGGMTDLPRLPELLRIGRPIRDNGPLKAYLLKEVTLGGHFFNDVLSLGTQRIHWFSNITSLTIRNYVNPGGSSLSLYGFVSTVQTCTSLQTLILEDVAFVNDVHPSYRFNLDAPTVRLRNVSDGAAFATLVSQSLGTHLKEVISITECPFETFGNRNLFRTSLPATNLLLDGMNASCTALEQLVCFWNGESLSLINCPGVSSSFMRNLPTHGTPALLRSVRIVDCGNVCVRSLINWVRSRAMQSEIDAIIPGLFDAEPCMALTDLEVHGRGPSIGREHARWFADHLEFFAWDTITRDGVRHTWDYRTRDLVVSYTN